MIQIDFNYLIEAITPPLHRTVEVIASIKSTFAPLDNLKTKFYTYFEKVRYELTFNGQVCMLEKLLNNEFDPQTNGIFITDAQNLDKHFLFNKAENNETTYLHNEVEGASPVYIYNKVEVVQYHFIVNIPSTVTFNEDSLKFYVNKYKLAGKRWKIKIV